MARVAEPEYVDVHCLRFTAMPDDEPLNLPSEVDLKLRLGIFRLLDAKYRSSLGDQSKFLCAGIVNGLLLEPPSNEDAIRFLEVNRSLVEQESMTLHLDPRLSRAISLLYTLTLIRLGTTNLEKSDDLANRASELNVVILSANEVCKARGISVVDDAMEFLSVIDKYASELLGSL